MSVTVLQEKVLTRGTHERQRETDGHGVSSEEVPGELHLIPLDLPWEGQQLLPGQGPQETPVGFQLWGSEAPWGSWPLQCNSRKWGSCSHRVQQQEVRSLFSRSAGSLCRTQPQFVQRPALQKPRENLCSKT